MRALVTGINGMDGSYMADKLLVEGWEVYGLERRTSNKNRLNTKHLEGKITFVNGDLTDQNSLLRALTESRPDVIFNYAAQSFVGESWNTPEQTGDVSGIGVLRMLEAIREYGQDVRFYQASTSEMFGRMVENPANENTPFYPRSPYGVAKLYGHWITRNYRESYNIFAVSGILFNHESERRGIEFVTRKITDGVARIYHGQQDSIALGNLDSKRDWGYAPDFVDAVYKMMTADTPNDYVIATGVTRTIRQFLDVAFKCIGVDDWSSRVTRDERFMRPAEIDVLRGDPTKAREELGWEPTTPFEEWVGRMVDNDKALVEKEL